MLAPYSKQPYFTILLVLFSLFVASPTVAQTLSRRQMEREFDTRVQRVGDFLRRTQSI